jgi:hypothetical protein
MSELTTKVLGMQERRKWVNHANYLHRKYLITLFLLKRFGQLLARLENLSKNFSKIIANVYYNNILA